MPSEQNSFSSNSHHRSKDVNTTTTDTSFCTIEPIHSKSQTSFLSIKTKTSPSKPAFGTTASRSVQQLQGNKKSDIVAYSRIIYQKNEKYHDHFEQIKAKLTPFMSTCSRFDYNKMKHPGPGQYIFPQIFKMKQESKSKQGPMFCPFKRRQSKENQSPESKYEEEKAKVYLCNRESYHSKNAFEIQQRIKQKREKIKEKMTTLKQKMKKTQKNYQFMFTRMGYRENEENFKPEVVQSPKKTSTEAKDYPKSLDLKQLTSKYLPKINYEFERQEYRITPQIKNFKEKFTFQPMFIAKNQDLFSSYIPKSQGPGPGYYQKRTKKPFKSRESSKIQKILI